MPTPDDLLILPRQAVFCLAKAETLAGGLEQALVPAGDAFLHNLHSVSLILAIPHRISQLALAPEARSQMGKLAQQAFREATAPGGRLARLEAKRAALENFNAKLTNELLPDFYAKAAQRARDILANNDVGPAVHELLCQCIVLSWGAFEVLARDVAVALVNAKPSLTSRLMATEPTKRLFGDFKLTLDDLAASGFDLSRQMGDLVLRGRLVDRLENIKALYGALLPDASELRSRLADRELWLLYQRRHVVVHRRGVIDQEYLAKTGEQLEPGSRLNIDSKQSLASLTMAADAGAELLLAANAVAHRH